MNEIMDYLWYMFETNFVSSVVGSAFGIYGALWLQSKTKKQQKIQKRIDLIKALEENLEKNAHLVTQMMKEVKPDTVIYYNVDTSILESTASVKYEILHNYRLNKKLDSLRYELQHLERKIDLQLEITYNGLLAMTNYRKIRADLIVSIGKHLRTIEPLITECLEIIQGTRM